MSGPYAAPPNMQGYEPPQGYANKNEHYPNQGYPSGGYQPPKQEFTPTYPPVSQHVPIIENNPNDTDHVVKGFEFSDQSIRRGFIRKVYAILSVQLIITLGAVMMFTYHDASKKFAQTDNAVVLLIVAMVSSFIIIIAISCCEGARRQFPTNFILLSLFTIAFSYMTAMSTTRFDAETVVQGVGITAVIVIGLTIFAMQTKWDFTMMGGMLFVALFVLIIFGFIASFSRSDTVHLIYSCLGALLFSFYIVYDTQMMMGGNHKYAMSPEEYILGAIALYLDIINLLLHILRILGASKN